MRICRKSVENIAQFGMVFRHGKNLSRWFSMTCGTHRFRHLSDFAISLLTQYREPRVERMYYTKEGARCQKRMGLCGGLKQTRSSCVCMTCQHFSYVRDNCHTLLTCGLLAGRQVPHGDLTRVPQLDGSQGSGDGLVPGGGVMREGWLIDRDDCWIWRFWRDESAWVRTRRYSSTVDECLRDHHC